MKHNLKLYLIISVIVILLGVIIGLIIYYTKKNNKLEDSQPESIYPDDNNTIILVNDKFIRYDPGLYDRPTSYEGVIHHGPKFIDLDS